MMVSVFQKPININFSTAFLGRPTPLEFKAQAWDSLLLKRLQKKIQEL